jgi:hypothetical protein
MLGRVLPWLVLAALVVAAVLGAGWHTGGTLAPGSADPSGAASPAGTSLSEAHAQRLARTVRLLPGDLPRGFLPDPAGPDTTVDEETGLDLCAASFPSDGSRLAARSEVFSDPVGRRVRTRVVVYRDGAAEQALAELRRAAPRCTRAVPPRPVQQPDTLALRVLSTGSLNRAARHELVVERRADVVVLLDTDRLSGATMLRLARTLGGRLVARLPDDAEASRPASP